MALGRAIRRAAAAALIALAAAAPAAAQNTDVSAADYGGFRNVLPGGQGETVSPLEFAGTQGGESPPPSFTSQLPLYRDIVRANPTLTKSDLDRFFKSERFGLAREDVASTERPRPGVLIMRDRRYNVPHVFGDTRADVMFGAGYASATDRLFFMDVLRNTGRAQLASLIGPGEDDENIKMDAEQFKVADYSEQELQGMIDRSVARSGSEGAQLKRDLDEYVAGVNAYIAEARSDPNKLPVEYPAVGKMPADWKATDTVAVAALIGAIFGRGGGSEGKAAEILREITARYGEADSRSVFKDLRRENDPEAPVTTTRGFPFDEFGPGAGGFPGAAVPDLNSQQDADVIVSDSAPGGLLPGLALPKSSMFPQGMSNALLVNGSRSSSGRPLAVMGPQVSYFSPQILLELDLHGGGIDARGAAFPGISLYVLLGRGKDYAWSATSSSSDNVDEFVEKLCEPDGSRPTTASNHYLYRGRCIPFVERTREYTAGPVPTSPDQPPKRVKLRVFRSVHGPIQARATVGGEPVAIAEARSTYMNELDSARAFEDLNANQVNNARDFQRTMSKINFSFNWFYADDRDTSYYSSAWIPKRAPGSNSSLPTWGTGDYDWQGFDPETFTSRRLESGRLPQDINPSRGYLASWNNKQAPRFRAPDDIWGWSSVHRSERLEDRIRAELKRGKTDLTRLTQIVIDAATVDLRGQESVPLLRDAMPAALSDRARRGIDRLAAWQAGGAHRRDLNGDNVYDDSAAVAIMDVWWPRLLEAMYRPALGGALYSDLQAILPIDDPPGPQGSAYILGWYGYVDKDLRRVLGRPVKGRLSRLYCGNGDEERCRRALADSLDAAVATVEQRYGSLEAARVPATCETEDPPACDQIEFTTAGAVQTPAIPWQDRPTFQQVVEVLGHRARPAAAPRGRGQRRGGGRRGSGRRPSLTG